MSRKVLIVSVLALVFLATPALAEEIIYFTNGTTMAIESYAIKDETVRVNLGGQAFMEFPREQIDRIESAAGQVSLSASGANRVVPGGTGGAPVSGYKRPDHAWGQSVGEEKVNPDIGVADNGLAVYRPFGANAAPNKRKFGASGRRELTSMGGGRPGTAGAQRVGKTIVLPGKNQSTIDKQQLVGFEASPSVTNKNKGKQK